MTAIEKLAKYIEAEQASRKGWNDTLAGIFGSAYTDWYEQLKGEEAG